MNLEIAVLKEQKLNLQAILERTEDQAKESSKTARDKLLATVADFENQLAQQVVHHTHLLQLEERRGNQMEKDLASAKNAAAVLEERLVAVGVQLDDMRGRLAERQGPSSSQVQEVDSLNARIRKLEALNKDLVQREKDIDARYKKGDLVRLLSYTILIS
jgi:chromosome segregation ATPase